MSARWLTLRQVAEQIGCHWKTVYKLVKTGALAASRVGDGPKASLRVQQVDLDAHMAARRVRPDVPSRAVDIEQCAREEECRALGIDPDHEFM